MLAQLRADTPGCQFVNHLNNAGASLPPASVLQAMQEFLTLEAHIGGYEAADQRSSDIQGFYSSVAHLLNTSPKNIAFAGSATDAYARVLCAINWKPGDIILTTENDYISNQIAFLALKKRYGIQLLRARDGHAGGVDIEDFEQLLRKHRPRLAAVTHIPTNSGLVQPVEAIGAICRELDVFYLVDACQSAGQMPLDVQKIQCDFLSATLRKFLRGPRGAGFLYVSDRALAAGLELPAPDMRGANWTGADEYVSVDSARRFEYWEMAPALLLGSRAAVDYALHLGLDWIQAQTTHIAVFTRKTLSDLPGVEVLDRGEELSGIVTAHASHWEMASMLEKLSRHKINCRITNRQVAQIDFQRKGVDWALRVSPHYYNTEDEIRQLAEVLQQEFPR